MFILILLLILGSGFVYISRYNFMPVSVNLGFYQFTNVPLFYVITISVLLGLVIAYLFQLAKGLSTALTLRSKDQELKKNQEKILELTKRVHQLELEKQHDAVDSDTEDSNAL